MHTSGPSALETAVLHRLYEVHRAIGFPPVTSVRVRGRTETPCGRYVDLEADAEVQLPSGYLDFGGYIQMVGLPNGMMAVVLVRNHRLVELEFATYGGDAWDGEERQWTLT
jgi:hypothetical protein